MWVKICGNTRLDDCLLAARLGADAVGFVFAAGKRTVNAHQVADITAQLPAGLETFGVFTTQDAVELAAAVNTAGLTGVQLHSHYQPGFVSEFRQRMSGHPIRLLQVVQWDLHLPLEEQLQNFAVMVEAVDSDGLVDALLIDSSTAQSSGGTGRTFDWKAAAGALQQVSIPVIVAGGLRPGNVADAIRTLAPAGVDVSSGVEHAPGKKDASAMTDFIHQAR